MADMEVAVATLGGVGEQSIDDDFHNLLELLEKSTKPKKLKKHAAPGDEGGAMDKVQYARLLNRVFVRLQENNPQVNGTRRPLLRPPIVEPVGSSRILWKNFAEICKTMNRDHEHVSYFVLSELGATGSMTSGKQLLIRGKFKPKYIESLLKKYISEYVTCIMCRGVSTELSRDTTARINIMTCESCGATRAVVTIVKGFQAATRAERRVARNAA